MKATVETGRAKAGLRAREKGLTLIEMVITIIVLGIALAAVVSAIASMSGRSADPLILSKTNALAQAYLDEILTKRYADASPNGGGAVADESTLCSSLGPDGTETRQIFDDVDDYHNPTNSAPADQQGNNLAGYQGFLINITVACDGLSLGLDNRYAKRIDVNIAPPGQPVMTYSVYRGYL